MSSPRDHGKPLLTNSHSIIVFVSLHLSLTLCSTSQLDGAHLEVTSAAAPAAGSTSLPIDANASTPIGAPPASVDEHGISQEDKPKAGIMAECTWSSLVIVVPGG